MRRLVQLIKACYPLRLWYSNQLIDTVIIVILFKISKSDGILSNDRTIYKVEKSNRQNN